MFINRSKLTFFLIVYLLGAHQLIFANSPVILYEVEDNYPPFKHNQHGEFHGFEIELSENIFNVDDYSVKFSTNNWEIVYDKLKNEEIDTCGMLAINEERKKEVLFTDVVLTGYISIYTRVGFPTITTRDLKKHRVGVGRSQYSENLLRKNLGSTKYYAFSSIEEAIEALDKGTIDVLFENQEVVNYYLIEKGLRGKIIPQETNLYPVDVAYGVRRGNQELVNYINRRLSDLRDTGVYEDIYQKYFFAPSKYYQESQRNKLLIIIFCVIIVFILLQIYIKYLKKKITRTYRELRKHHEWLRVTLSSIGDAVIATDEKGNVTFTNHEAQNLFSIYEDEFMGRSFSDILKRLKDENGNQYKVSVDEVIKEGVVVNLESNTVLTSGDGDEHLITGTIAPIRNDSADIIGTVSALKDITELKRTEKILFNMEYYDSLTGLPNKTLFSDRLNMALAHARRSDSQCAIIILDLDNFKTINDTLGHTCGDKLLKQVADKIKSFLREVDTVARFGGDEFVILQPEIKNITDATRAADRIVEKFQNPWLLEDKEYYVTASMGIAVYPNDGQDEQTLLKNADAAMYRAKETGKNNYQMFTESMNTKILQKLEMENNLRRAIEREEFVLFYQPQIDILTGKIVGMEALIRWYHEGFGLVPPMDFIPLAEESGLIIPIGEWVLNTACKQNVEWIKAGFEPLLIAVNLSARQFQQQNLVEIIENALDETGLDPKLLELEITESTAMQDINFTIEVLTKLREKGIRISLDDFGTGYSSLNYLKRLPINTLKIDKSFVHDITENSNEEAIAKSVISLAHKMLLLVVAEGVETNEQLAFLKEQQCDKVQGYLFSKPLPANEVEVLLKNRDVLGRV